MAYNLKRTDSDAVNLNLKSSSANSALESRPTRICMPPRRTRRRLHVALLSCFLEGSACNTQTFDGRFVPRNITIDANDTSILYSGNWSSNSDGSSSNSGGGNSSTHFTPNPPASSSFAVSGTEGARFASLDGSIYTTTENVNKTGLLPVTNLETAESGSSSLAFTTSTIDEFERSSFSPISNAPSSSSSLFASPTIPPTLPALSPSSSTPTPTPSITPIPAPFSVQSVQQLYTNPPINAANQPPSLSSDTPNVSPSESAAAGLSAETKRSIIIASVFVAAVVAVVVLVLLLCIRYRRGRRRREEEQMQRKQHMDISSRSSRDRLSPFPQQRTHPYPTTLNAMPRSQIGSPSPSMPMQQRYSSHSPSSAPSMSPIPPTASPRRIPRSPLATTPPFAPTPSPQILEFPMPPGVTHHIPPFSSSSSSYTASAIAYPAPTTPLPLTPSPPPPVTPGTPWTITKSQRTSSDGSVYSYDDDGELGTVECGVGNGVYGNGNGNGGGVLGYGWTTPSLVGIHPFSAAFAQVERGRTSQKADSAPASSSTRRSPQPSRNVPNTPSGLTTPLTPKLDEKSAEALFRREAEERRVSAAPEYREKDVAQAVLVTRGGGGGGELAVGSRASQAAPPLYEP
ncbi:hypothetical protein R3P38DRAFT_3575533 [Favolaschia claudopus]|uniref:Uncharacterized protein n=1 Tax=Favolaschia claudopus TaxID=2862362 RepID=A0AAW0AM74_9AGAR